MAEEIDGGEVAKLHGRDGVRARLVGVDTESDRYSGSEVFV